MDSKNYINDIISPCERHYSEMTLTRSFSTRGPDEQEKSRISDVIVLDCDVIMVADSTHCVIKAFNLDGDYLSSSERLDQRGEGGLGPDEIDQLPGGLFGPMHSMFSMTIINSDSIAVTLPGSNKFAVVLLTPEKKIFIRFIKDETFHKYWSLASWTGNTYISSTEKLVDVMNVDFKPIGRLTSEFDFQVPSCIAVSPNGNVVIADSEKQCIVVVGSHGYILHRMHLGIVSLRGIDVDGDNIFFVSSHQHDLSYFSTKGGTIHVVRAKHIQNELDTPIAIRYRGNGDVIVGEEGGNVKLYHLDAYYRPNKWLTRWRTLRQFCFASLPWRQFIEMIGLQGFLELFVVLLLPVSEVIIKE